MKKIFSLSFCLLACAAMQVKAQNTKPYSWSNLPKATLPVFKKDTFNIVKYGAVADGITLNTKAINAAINACSAKGGGVVLIPQGLWITGPIVLKSNVNLHVSRSAMVQFTEDKSQYALVEGSYEGKSAMRNQSPISGTKLVNIAITGGGIIDGAGNFWRAIGKDRLTESEWKKLVESGGVVSANGKSWYPSASFAKAAAIKDVGNIQPGKSVNDYAEYKDFFRPNMVVLTDCKKVLLNGTTFQNSPNWCLHTITCQDLTLNDVHVRNPWNAQNGDAIDVESCKNVLIENSTFDAGDDGLCIKSGRDEEGRKRGIPTENVTLRNNIVYRAHGGFVIGSEMSGGAKNIFVTDCTFIGTDIGLRFKTARGRGGVVENIYIKNIAMRDILGDAILFDMYYMSKSGSTLGMKDFPKVDDTTPQFKNFYVNNVVCNGAGRAIMVRGLPEMSIKNIYLENMVLKADKGVELIEANNINLKNITVESKATNPLINIENSTNINLESIKYITAEQLLSVKGDRSGNIHLIKTNTANAKSKVEFSAGADEKMLTIK
jgi:polygalacturonase